MQTNDQTDLVRHEDELRIGKRVETVGRVQARKRIEVERVGADVPCSVERAGVERVATSEGDSGQVETLSDGSISIPVIEEELVITKRLVVRERIVIRKEVVTETQRVEADLRREHVAVDVDDRP